MLIVSQSVSAVYFEVDGIRYEKEVFYDRVAVVQLSSGKYTGRVVIPSSVNYDSKTYPVTTISSSAFYGCTALTSVSIPSSVTSIGTFVFMGCTNLEEVEIGNGVKTMGNNVFQNCKKLKHITYKSNSAFDFLSSVQSDSCMVYVPYENIELASQYYKGNLYPIGIFYPNIVEKTPNVVKFEVLESPYFEYNYLLSNGEACVNAIKVNEKSFNIEDSVHVIECEPSTENTIIIEYQYFSGVVNMPSHKKKYIERKDTFVIISDKPKFLVENTVRKLDRLDFNIQLDCSINSSDYEIGCILNYDEVLRKVDSDGNISFTGLWPSIYTVVPYVHYGETILYGDPLKFQTETLKFLVENTVRKQGRLDFNIQLDCSVNSSDYEIGCILNYDEVLRKVDGDDNVSLIGLCPGATYTIVPYFYTVEMENSNYDSDIKYLVGIPLEFQTDATKLYMSSVKSTQSTITVNPYFEPALDETAGIDLYVYVSNSAFQAVFEDGKYVFTGLPSNTSYTVRAIAQINGNILPNGNGSVSKDIKTKSILPKITQIGEAGPTTINLNGSYSLGDATLDKAYFADYEAEGEYLQLTGLEPNTTYNFTYSIETKEGGRESATISVRTPSLVLKTLAPKSVSETCAIVAAETNISEHEPNVGFQWKKYDAPESLNPSEGYAAIYDGKLEGYIKRLQPTSYYNVRAFYKSNAGRYYYGAWVTFDPSDFSYFEPTVHTYPAEDVTHNAVKVRGYVLAGTEEVTEQGFQYWEYGAGEYKARMAYASATEKDVTTVFASGQVMSVVLDNLKSSTTYCCRAFVKTESGITYGEEQTFTTSVDVTGIGDVTMNKDDAKVTGIYDIYGRKHSMLQRGINIIHYSNGVSRKVYVKE